MPPGVRVTQVRLLATEWVKFRSLRSSYVAMAATVVALVGLGLAFCAVMNSRWALLEPAERAAFDPAATSLKGLYLAQLVIGVLGVLVVSGEYGTGMIRASLSVAPRRLPVLWAKLVVFAVVTFVVTTVAAFVAFFAGQAMLSGRHIQTTLGAPDVLRVVVGTGLYLTVVGLLGVALGWIIRHTAGAVGTVFGLLLVLPVLGDVLPASWALHVTPYLPSMAGQAMTMVLPEPGMLAPWTGFAVFCGYVAVAVAAAAVLLKRRDA
jgi:ABC-type transport system involved in multi-copper enzyme maturation permease subunit